MGKKGEERKEEEDRGEYEEVKRSGKCELGRKKGRETKGSNDMGKCKVESG